jgi:two-component system KDP operon response regulator KdpE
MSVSKRRVLVVDDEPGVLKFVRISLSAAGYDVITASGGEEGLKLLESAKPDIMLLDIVMEPVSGIDVLLRLRHSPHIPVIVFTAQSVIAESALSIGAKGYISKPFMPDDLVRKIEEILDAQSTS